MRLTYSVFTNAAVLLVATAVLGLMALIPTSAQASSSTVYGALVELANLENSDSGITNQESVLTYLGGEDGFVAMTTVDGDNTSEWWTSNGKATVWSESSNNPLADNNCRQPGRHGVHTFNGGVYFGADCEDTDGNGTAMIFRLDDHESATVIHEKPDTEEETAGNYPTAQVLGGNLYMFYNGGYTVCDTDEVCTDVEDATNQPAGVPLEASTQDTENGVLYLAFTSGEVMTFDGSEYTEIGSDYLDAAGPMENLPAVEYFNETAYVGEQNMDGEARLFKYDADDEDEDGETWEVVYSFDEDTRILNKMQLTNDYLIVYTASNEGVGVYAVDEDDNVTLLIDEGLGGTDPENNTEVVSAIRRRVTDGLVKRDILLFGTQNHTDQTKIFALLVGPKLAHSPLAKTIAGKDQTVEQGDTVTVKIPKKLTRRNVGDRFSLVVDGEVVTKKRVKKKKRRVWLKLDTSAYDSGEELDVAVGREIMLGNWKRKGKLSTMVVGESFTVTVE